MYKEEKRTRGGIGGALSPFVRFLIAVVVVCCLLLLLLSLLLLLLLFLVFGVGLVLVLVGVVVVAVEVVVVSSVGVVLWCCLAAPSAMAFVGNVPQPRS